MITCPACNGNGYQGEPIGDDLAPACHKCSGQGRIMAEEL